MTSQKDEFLKKLKEQYDELNYRWSRERDKFEADPALVHALMEKISASAGAFEKPQLLLLDRLIRMYAAPDSHFLNYYGPPGTIPTTSYHQLISRQGNLWVVSDLSEYKGKAVFIGLSERSVPLKADGFHTVYSGPDGVDSAMSLTDEASGVADPALVHVGIVPGRDAGDGPVPVPDLDVAAPGAARADRDRPPRSPGAGSCARP